MSSNRHVKIVIPCANEGPWLRATVDSVLATTRYPSFEVLISANGDHATDFSFLELPPYRGRVRLQRTPEFLGVGGARNSATSPGDADFYVFLDAHCLLEADDWLARGVECLEEHPHASMVQPEVVSFIYEADLNTGEDLDPSRIRRGCPEYSTRWAWPYDHAWRAVETITFREKPTPYEAMSGAGMATFVRAETFHRLGRFDGEVGGWFHETMDYCVRSWMLGHPMIVEPRFRVLHRMKMEKIEYPRMYLDMIHGTLRTAWKYLSPPRRDLAESLFRKHGRGFEVDTSLSRIRAGGWLAERVAHLRERVHDDDWLFARFGVYEEQLVGK